MDASASATAASRETNPAHDTPDAHSTDDQDQQQQLDEWSGQQDPLADPDERAHLYAVLDSFRQYRRHTLFTTTHVRRQAFYALPQAHWQLLAGPPVRLLDSLSAVDDAIADNAAIAEAIYDVSVDSMGLTELKHGTSATEQDDDDDDDDCDSLPPWAGKATANDHTKARSTVHQLYRDWSADGAAERAAVFDPIFADLSSYLPTSPSTQPPRVLVPGAGLGRLVFELCHRGYAAAGNDVSYHQLLASAWVLNHTTAAGQWPLHPFATQFSNVRARADQLRTVRVPDVCPAHAGDPPHRGCMSMAAGDFCELYGPGAAGGDFDAVVTLFFIDTAPNLLRYIDTVRHALRPGGIWCNVGPLLWHFEPPPLGQPQRQRQHEHDDDDDGDGDDDGDHDGDASEHTSTSPRRARARIGAHGSFELAHDEVLALVAAQGFAVERADGGDGGGTGYVGNERALLESRYKPVHWVARRLG